MEIQKEHEGAFEKKFLEIYLSRGFGSMNKNDLEVLIFDLLRRYGDGNLDAASTFEISQKLKITETKVKRLVYEANLQYGDYNDVKIRQMFFSIIAKAKFKSANNQIVFNVDNRIIKSAIEADLKSEGYFSDTSYNRDLMTMHLDAFTYLLDKYYPSGCADKIRKQCTKIVKSDTSVDSIWKSSLKKILECTLKVSGEQAISSIFTLIAGGENTLPKLIEFLNNCII